MKALLDRIWICRVIALVMYLPAAALAPFGTGTVGCTLLASTGLPGRVECDLMCEVFPK